MKNAFMTLVISLVSFLALSAVGNNSRDISKVGPRTEKVNREMYQKICYVSINSGSDQNGDGSRDKPWQLLTHALSRINDASESHKYAVLLAEGIYSSGTIVMKAWVDLYGGFSPQTWERNIFAHRTILEGGRVRRVVVGASHACLDGFVIQNGLSRTHGGGILCDDTSPTISNDAILDNFALEPQDFNHQRIHQPGHHGGGIACLYNATPVIRNNLISGNRTSIGNGGGIAFYGWVRLPGNPKPNSNDNRLGGGLQALVENNVITANAAGVNDLQRTRSSNGGGISCAFEARPIIRNNIIAGNQAYGRGDGGGIYNEYYADPLIEENWVIGNIADDDGGGIYTMRMGQPLIARNFIAGNWAPAKGVGGIRLSKEGRARIVGNVIVRNLSGGGVVCSDSRMDLENNIIMHNQGGQAVTYEARLSYFMPTLIRNNTLRDNEQEPILVLENYGQPLIVQSNNIQGQFEGRDNYNAVPAFATNSITGKATSTHFDAISFTTAVAIEEPIGDSEQLAGRVLRLGDRWSVIKAAQSTKILVWGDLGGTHKKMDWEVISDYQAK